MPSFIANIGSYLLGTTQHCGLPINSSDFRKNTRSIKINPVLGFLYWHMNWHAEHHMYAGVPCYNLKAMAKEIASDMPEPKSLIGAWKEMRETWARQKTEPAYVFDRPVPTRGDTPPESTEVPPDDGLIDSIGDLAPSGSELT